MPLQDLRTFLQTLDTRGDLKTLRDADPNLEIGAITELSLQRNGPALLFESILGYAPKYRVAANVLSTPRRALLALGMDPELPEDVATRKFQEIWDNFKPVPPRMVDTGPVLENVRTGDDIDLLQFPVPLWHERDGGPYIGTGGAIIHRDPDSGAVNVGTYRVQLHDKRTTGLFTNNETDGRQIMEKYWAAGKPAPVAISFGPEPLLFASAASNNGSPKGPHEYEYTGYLAGEPVSVIRGAVTGLPISAHSEIAIEGEVAPPTEKAETEGPFGEWTGYYEFSQTREPVVQVKALYFRNDPILFGAPPFYLRANHSYSFALSLRSAGTLSRFAQMELPVRRMVPIGPFGCTVVTVEQQHKDDVPRILDALAKSGFARLTIVLDDDVDPYDPWDVLWALSTRVAPDDTRIIPFQNRNLLDPLRPMGNRATREPLADKRMIINGCRAFERLADFPPVNRFSEERREEVWAKWSMADWLK